MRQLKGDLGPLPMHGCGQTLQVGDAVVIVNRVLVAGDLPRRVNADHPGNNQSDAATGQSGVQRDLVG